MSEDASYLLLFSIYFLMIFYFIYVSGKCFWEKFSVKKLIGAVLFSPVLVTFLTTELSSTILPDVVEGQRIESFCVLYGLLQILFLAAFSFFYLLCEKPQNNSIAVFVYLSFALMVPNMIQVFVSDMAISMFLGNCFVMVIFYVLVVRPMSNMKRKKLATEKKLFVILPVLTTVFNTILFGVYLKQALWFAAKEASFQEFMKNVDQISEQGVKDQMFGYLKSVIRESSKPYDNLYYISNVFISLILIIAFSIIVKNIRYLNETIQSKADIHDLFMEVMEAMEYTIGAKDQYTRGHSSRVAKYSRMIAEKMGMGKEECEQIYQMGLVHDIGKIAVPKEIINKSSGLTDSEYDQIQMHVDKGYEILSQIKSRPWLAKGAKWHHERPDGKGYPDHLKREEIPLEARIIAVADTYDAMTSNRSYRSYLPQAVVREEILKNIGTQFDKVPAECMIAIMDEDKDYVLHE